MLNLDPAFSCRLGRFRFCVLRLTGSFHTAGNSSPRRFVRIRCFFGQRIGLTIERFHASEFPGAGIESLGFLPARAMDSAALPGIGSGAESWALESFPKAFLPRFLALGYFAPGCFKRCAATASGMSLDFDRYDESGRHRRHSKLGNPSPDGRGCRGKCFGECRDMSGNGGGVMVRFHFRLRWFRDWRRAGRELIRPPE